MTNSVIRITTLITAGVVIGIALGAVFTGGLPWWLSAMTIGSVCYVASLA